MYNNDNKTEKILVVDDEKEIADLLEVYLKNNGYSVYKAYNGKEALKYIDSVTFDVALLDIMLPDTDGFALCRKIRENHFYPIIMLSAKVSDFDKINGLAMGADDYITKPFNPLEVLARVRTQLRRYTQYNQQKDTKAAVNECDIKGLHINIKTHKCTLLGKELALTPTEFSLLWYLCVNKGKVIPSEELFEAVWNEKYYYSNNTVMAHIARIREKMNEQPRNPKYIKTVWGVGYTIEN